MKIHKPLWILYLVTLISGIAGAFLIGNHFSRDRGEHPSTTTQTAVQYVLAQDAPSLVEFISPQNFESRFERIRSLLKLLDLAETDELERYWEQSESLDLPSVRRQIQRRIIQRYAALDLNRSLIFVQNEAHDSVLPELVGIVFQEWSLVDLDEAINHVRNLDRASVKAAVKTIVRTRSDVSFARRRELAREFECEWIAFEVLNQTSDGPTLDDPRGGWYGFVEEFKDGLLDLNESQFRTLSYITYFWVLSGDESVMDSMSDTLPSDFALNLMMEFASRKLIVSHPSIAIDFVVELLNRDRESAYNELALDLFDQRANDEPIAAFEATLSIKADIFRYQVQKQILEVAARRNNFDLLSNLQHFPKSARNLGQEVALIEMAKQSPEIVVAKLTDVGDIERRDRVATQLAMTWAAIDIESTLAWIEADNNVAHNRENLKRVALESLTRTDVELALELALELPVRKDGQGWEQIVVQQLALTDTDSALSLLPRVRAGNTRRDVYDWVMTILASHEYDIDKAMDLMVELCALEPRGTRLGMARDFMSLISPREVFARLDQIPSAESQANFAKALLRDHGESNVFSPDELKMLNKLEQSRPVRPVSQEFLEAASEAMRLYQEQKTD